MQLTSIPYDLLLIAHVLAALVTLAASGATSYYASEAAKLSQSGLLAPSGPGPGGARAAAVHRYFRPGPNVISRAAFAVPVLGVSLVLASGRPQWWGELWIWIGILTWLAGLAAAAVYMWPSERALQQALSSPPPLDRGVIAHHARRAGRGGAAVDVAYALAFISMLLHLR